ncbi:unnamed protein product [Acanthoscelides obtectus]|uniref:Uncharacterized protein n=1 Tax=Acanthoscelides obtectus TaxID=200917 RepID=A0A9P0LG09_ACAOB|nr:unnamed protein product [Acanthoscelides obtectus]CAK1624122.1 hypothetical protein AOBTE_LOCUS2334 [Acanthoscelides obtectus]
MADSRQLPWAYHNRVKFVLPRL